MPRDTEPVLVNPATSGIGCPNCMEKIEFFVDNKTVDVRSTFVAVRVVCLCCGKEFMARGTVQWEQPK